MFQASLAVSHMDTCLNSSGEIFINMAWILPLLQLHIAKSFLDQVEISMEVPK